MRKGEGLQYFAFGLLAAALLAGAVARMAPRDVKDIVLAEGDCCNLDGDLALRLDRFDVSHYPSGAPRQYASLLKTLDNATGESSTAETSVNHPLRRNGWWIYQMGCGIDESEPMRKARRSVLRCVRDPLLPIAAAAGVFAVAGALLLCFAPRKEREIPSSRLRRALSLSAAAAVACLPVAIIARVVFAPEPPPALQSGLMSPHVAAYAASYLILLFAAFGICRRAVPIGFFLMTTGLVVGALWGKMAWSDWWQFDPKENWSLATWCAFAAYLMLPKESRWSKVALSTGAVLIVITLTWVNFSKFAAGRHSYASEAVKTKHVFLKQPEIWRVKRAGPAFWDATSCKRMGNMA